jgi:hypothetical protein
MCRRWLLFLWILKDLADRGSIKYVGVPNIIRDSGSARYNDLFHSTLHSSHTGKSEKVRKKVKRVSFPVQALSNSGQAHRRFFFVILFGTCICLYQKLLICAFTSFEQSQD